MWIFPWVKPSWHSCSMWDKLGWLNWFWKFSVRGYVLLTRKDTATYMHRLAVYVKEGLISRNLSPGNSAGSYLCLRLALLHSMSHVFFLYQSPSSFSCTAFDAISSNIDEVVSINSSANVFDFGDFNIHHKDRLTFSGKSGRSGSTDGPGKSCYDFSNDLTQTLNFTNCISDCDSHSPALLDLFISSYSSICSTMAFSP